MGKSLAQKKEIVTKVEKRISSAQLMFSLKLEKVTMPEINGLRNSLPAGTTAIVIKNRLLKRASSGTPWSATESLSKGSNIWVVVDDDVKGSIKAFKDWQKANKKEDGILGGVVEGQVRTQNQQQPSHVLFLMFTSSSLCQDLLCRALLPCPLAFAFHPTPLPPPCNLLATSFGSSSMPGRVQGASCNGAAVKRPRCACVSQQKARMRKDGRVWARGRGRRPVRSLGE